MQRTPRTKAETANILLCAVLLAAALFCDGVALSAGGQSPFALCGIILSVPAPFLALLYFAGRDRQRAAHLLHWFELFHILAGFFGLLAARTGPLPQFVAAAVILVLVLVLGLYHFPKRTLPLLLCGVLLLLHLLVFVLELCEGAGAPALCRSLGELLLSLILLLCILAKYKTAVPVHSSET